jgi:hypothetical protein
MPILSEPAADVQAAVEMDAEALPAARWEQADLRRFTRRNLG